MRLPAAPLLLSIAVLVACSTPTTPDAAPLPEGPWREAKSVAILEAQDHRDVPRLLALLVDSSALVREQAALALASAGDSTAVEALLDALSDNDPVVRCNAAFAFGFCGDSVNVHRSVEHYSIETNTAVRGRIAEAMGRIGGSDIVGLLLRRSRDTHMDTLGVLLGLYRAALNKHSDTAAVRCALNINTRASEDLQDAANSVLFRSDAAALKPFVPQLLARAKATPFDEPLIPLLGALGRTADERTADLLGEWGIGHAEPRIRVAALRALGRLPEKKSAQAVWIALDDTSAAVRSTAVELMQGYAAVDGERLWKVAQEGRDYAVKIPLYALVMEHAGAETRGVCGPLLEAMAQQDLGPYLNAELIKAMHGTKAYAGANDPTQATLIGLMRSQRPALERITAFQCAWERIHHFLEQADIAGTNADFYGPLLREALKSGDAGLVAEAADRLSTFSADDLRAVLDNGTAREAVRSLAPIRDLEARQLLDAAIAKRDGRPVPKHVGPPFNHAIDQTRLFALGNGRRYRIITDKGEIVLDTEPGFAPGSCTAFDSLVSAGFYNGRYFHRVVPDFVAQGGCPRGDGYGAMDWTLRTEIGLSGFTTGAVGLASAGKDTESCQFFIMLAPAPHLDGRYTRFAHVVSGMDVAQRLTVGDRMVRAERIQ